MAGRSPTLTAFRADAVLVPNVRVEVSPPKGRAIVVPLRVAPVVVGSGNEADVVVADPLVSRVHCEVALTDRGISIRDLESKNGTHAGGVQIVEALIEPGTKVTFGGSKLVVRVDRGTSAVPLSLGARFGEALGGSVSMRALFARLEHAAATDETILLLGESGTGKELLARAIHDHSPRRNAPFVVFDCAAIAPTLAEAELFGYVRGAFTGALDGRAGLLEQAHGGTLFIDELGELPRELQPKLLRAMESREIRRLGAPDYRRVDVRFIAATHRDLRAHVADGSFREDLYYRLAVVESLVPPLRDRRDDIPLLVDRFLAAMTPPRTLDDLPPNALDLLARHNWPGNVRELRNTVARLILFPADAEQAVRRGPHGPSAGAGTGEVSSVVHLPLREARDVVVEQFERSYVRAKLVEAAGNVSRAAANMGVSRQFLHRLLDRYGLKERAD